MSNKKSLGQNSNLIKSILVIISYFILPYLVSFISDSNLFKYLIYAVYFIFIIYLYKDTFIDDIKNIKENKKSSTKTIILGVIAIFIITILVNASIGIIFNIKKTSENDYSLLKLFNESPFILMILTCIYYPVVEGVIFRKAIRDVVDKKWLFIIFSSLFYFFFNIVYTSMSFDTIMSSVCYFTTMMILSYIYFKTDNFTISMFILMLYNLIFSILNFFV